MTCNTNITNDELKYIPKITHLDLYWNRNITDDYLQYIPRIKIFMLNERMTKTSQL